MLTVRTAMVILSAGMTLTACAVPNGALVNPWVPPVISTPTPAPVSYVEVFKSQGSRQCENNGVPLAEMQRQLQMANIPVTNASCGTDGRMYPQFCGGADGKINVFSIPSDAVNAAVAQGFGVLSDLPGAQRTNCYGGNATNAPVNTGTSTTYPYNNNTANNNTSTSDGFIPYTGGNNDSFYSYQ